MNRSKRSMPANLRKKMTKAIHGVQSGTPSIANRRKNPSDVEKELDMLFPQRKIRKMQKHENNQNLNTIKKNIEIKKTKLKSHTSKRTTPGDVDVVSAPAFAHREGARWIKTIVKQNVAQKKINDRRGRKK